MTTARRSALTTLLLKTRSTARKPSPLDLVEPTLQNVGADGFISRENLRKGIKVQIEEWIGNVGRNEFKFLIKDKKFGGAQTLYEQTWDDASTIVFPFQFTLPPADLTIDGEFDVWYTVKDDNGDTQTSRTVLLIIDIMDPNLGLYPTPVSVPSEMVDDDYLNTNGGIVCNFAGALDEKRTDNIAWAWVKSEPTDWTGVVKLGVKPVDPADRTFTITTAQIEAAGSGTFYIVYVMADRAGNETHMAISQPVTVLLGPLPEVTAPPYLVLEPEWDDTVLDLLDAYAGVKVMIDEYTGWAPGDWIRVAWGAGESRPAEFYVPERPVFPLGVPLEWPTMLGEYTATEGAQSTPFSYRVRRETVLFPPLPAPSPTNQIDVDFSVIGPGPIDPVDPPDPVHPGLKLITIKPPVSGTDNVLEEADRAGVAKYEIELYDEVEDDHDIVVELAGYKLAPYVIDGEQPGDTLVQDLPWGFIDQVGANGVYPARYSIGDPAIGVNRRWSDVTDVTVNAIRVDLPTAHYPGYYDHPTYGPMIRCTELALTPNHALHIHLNPDAKYFPAGTKINLYYQPLGRMDGSGGPVDPSWHHEELNVEWELSETFLGKDWYVPYATVIKTHDVDERHSCLSQVWYTLSVGGVTVKSPIATCIISLYRIVNPGGEPRCEFTP